MQEFDEFLKQRERNKAEEIQVKTEMRSQSLDSLISMTRATIDRKGQNEGEFPVQVNTF